MTTRITELTAIAVGVILGARQSAPAQDRVPTERDAPRYHILVTGSTRTAVEFAVRGAIRRLSRPRCQQVFEDFTDQSGRRLALNLAATGKAPAVVMTELFFVDADQTIQCTSNEGVAAFTVPGSRVVHLCAKRFGRLGLNTSDEEIVLIHEFLHALGLGENPPDTRQITQAVLNRCR